MKKKRLIPFKMWPASWGLVGKPYAEAEAYYYYEGEELERALVDIRSNGHFLTRCLAMLDIDLKYRYIDAYTYDRQMLDLKGGTDIDRLRIDLKHGKITEREFDTKCVEAEHPEGSERERALLALQLKYGEISKNEHDKTLATWDETPWIGIVDQGFDLEKGVNGVFFEFDWNIFWIDYLRLHGYSGFSEEEIVERWFQDVCRATAQPQAPDDFATLPLATKMPMRSSTNTEVRDDGTFYS